MIEKLHGLTEREDAPVKKRKAQALDEDADDDQKKKAKGTFQNDGGGFMTEHLKEQRKKQAAENPTSNGAETIDLTNDDDEVQFIKENINERVCLGVLNGAANVFRIPAVSQNAERAFRDRWPRIKVTYERLLSGNTIIHLVDRSGAKFANLELKLAAALCKLLAGASMTKFEMKVFLVDREKGNERAGDRVSQSMRVEVILYAPLRVAKQIGTFLSRSQLFLSTPTANPNTQVFNPQEPKPLGGPARSGNQQITSAGSGGRTVEQILRETSSMFDSLTKDEDLPDMEADSSIITSPLMDHQKKALHFLMDRERSDYEGQELPSHSLWKYRSKDNGRPSWYHLITDQVVFEKPNYLQGGILADVMGLGKTLSILALVAETREAARRFRREGPEDRDGQLTNSKATLIICPKSVLSNWQEQIRNHSAHGKFKIYTYHGTSRIQDVDKLSRFDVVLTSYNTAATELHGKKSGLRDINWFRVVLDEAHHIRNPTTNVAKACCALNAQRRWAMTGTPVQNSLQDLGALFKFLHLPPFDSSVVWSQYITTPFKSGDAKVVEQLQILVRSVTLRRTKNTINLPDKKVERVRLNFSADERRLYTQFATKAGLELSGITQAGGRLRGKAYAHILKSLSRLRAICAHGREMLHKEDLEEIEARDDDGVIMLDIGVEDAETEESFVSERSAYDHLITFSDSEADMCQSCGSRIVSKENDEEDEDAEGESDSEDDEEGGNDLVGHLTPCLHLICTKCTERFEKEVQQTLTKDNHHTCPYCTAHVKFELFPLRKSILERIKAERKENRGKATGAKWDEDTYSGPSTKVKELLRELQQSAEETEQLPHGEPPIRSVVFSGFTQYLDLIEYALDNAEIGCTRIDGTMSVKQRSQALHAFNTVDSVRVLLVSIKAGGQGLNFTSANKAYVMEPGYNPAAEQQAVDRVHRIGQKRDVTIKHFIMADSIENHILKLQKRKEAIAKMSMDNKKTRPQEAKERMAELMELFDQTNNKKKR
ncbi:hypothetical protein M409DRAFT_65759 [Zasmidium cellare ATCC 36951]|uniref:Helicase ATP-binding domain-containing protein n=1 Tax=Zasmidium cellare ATCC 36951 TaxID=1080233 RepID=A0A6A6CM57_ZASCE|nr:uncharacterized protein M409DRAFT_65759 [Zasmidium cellare ATCC 36951]KAF2168317.1 hypothetical protein M409DRAFT_65759 [Zasmidium cellare ATCC 36951]